MDARYLYGCSFFLRGSGHGTTAEIHCANMETKSDFSNGAAVDNRCSSVWWIEGGKWHKENIWGGSSDYGDVYLKKESQKRYVREP